MEHLVSKIKQQTEASASARIAGLVLPYAGKSAPAGYLLCDGAAYAKADYPELFAAIGTTYGGTDAGTTFNVPNLAGRIPVGTSVDYALGSQGGEAKHTLTIDEAPSHFHETRKHDGSSVGFWPSDASAGSKWQVLSGGNTAEGAAYDLTTDAKGGGQPHNNMQPYVATNYIISTGKDPSAAMASNAEVLARMDELGATLADFMTKKAGVATAGSGYTGTFTWYESGGVVTCSGWTGNSQGAAGATVATGFPPPLLAEGKPFVVAGWARNDSTHAIAYLELDADGTLRILDPITDSYGFIYAVTYVAA